MLNHSMLSMQNQSGLTRIQYSGELIGNIPVSTEKKVNPFDLDELVSRSEEDHKQDDRSDKTFPDDDSAFPSHDSHRNNNQN